MQDDRSREGLRGPVKLVHLVHRMHVPLGACVAGACSTETEIRTFESREVLSEAGQRSEHWYRNPDGSEYLTRYEYRAGRLVRSGDSLSQIEFEYDNQNRLIKVRSGGRTTESLTYDGESFVRRFFVPEEYLSRKDCQFFHTAEGSFNHYSASGAVEIQTRHDRASEPSSMEFLDRRGRCLSRVDFLCRDGLVVRETQWSRLAGVPWLARLMMVLASGTEGGLGRMLTLGQVLVSDVRVRYDAASRWTEIATSHGRLGSERRVREYNLRGDPSVEVSEGASSEVGLGLTGLREVARPSPRSQKTLFEYEYDFHDNWLLQRVLSEDGTVSSEYHREIEYF